MSQNLSRQTGSQEIDLQEEISLIDILRFLKGAYKTILVFGALGLAIAIAYLVITPNRFEAVAQIQMAQTSGANQWRQQQQQQPQFLGG